MSTLKFIFFLIFLIDIRKIVCYNEDRKRGNYERR
nr:MAG TPA: hypothetical protein [Caudoviricetes sp.]